MAVLKSVLIHFFIVLARGLADDKNILDMTYVFDNNTIYWPTAQSFELQEVSKGLTSKGYWYESNNIYASEHGGTHLDAPVHFGKGKWTVEEIPLKNLIADAIVVDISERAATNSDAEVTVADLQNWEKQYGRIPDKCIVLMNSGWGQHWNNRTKYLGTDTKNTSLLHFPGFHPDAAQWLAANRPIYGVGVDTPSVDFGQSIYFQTHVNLFKKNIYGLENVANVDKIPVTGATLIVTPMKIRGGSGAPIRLIAMWDTNTSAGTSLKYKHIHLCLILYILKIVY